VSGGLRVELPKYSIDMQYRRGSVGTIATPGDAATAIVSPMTAQNSFSLEGQMKWPLKLAWNDEMAPQVSSYLNVKFGAANWKQSSTATTNEPGVVFASSLGQRFTWSATQGNNSGLLALDVGVTCRKILGDVSGEQDYTTLKALLNTAKLTYFGGELFAHARVNNVEVGGGLVLLLGDNVAGVTKGQFLPFASVTVPIDLASVPDTTPPVAGTPPAAGTPPPPGTPPAAGTPPPATTPAAAGSTSTPPATPLMHIQ